MATRRVRSTINNNYVQPLKLAVDRKLVICPNANYNSVLFTKKHKSSSNSVINVRPWAKFDSNDFDGIFAFAQLLKGNKIINAAECEFKLYSVSLDEFWVETLVISKMGVISNDKFIVHFTQADLGSIELDGERTFSIEVNIKRLGKTYTNKIYINHLGIYENVFRLRQDVEFLDITKVDE